MYRQHPIVPLRLKLSFKVLRMCPIQGESTKQSFRIVGLSLCPLSTLSLAGVILIISALEMSEGEKLNLYFSQVTKVVSELHSGPWAAPGQPVLEELSRPKTLKFRSSYQSKAERELRCPDFLQHRHQHKPLGLRSHPGKILSLWSVCQAGLALWNEWSGCTWIPNIQLSLLAAHCPLPGAETG